MRQTETAAKRQSKTAPVPQWKRPLTAGDHLLDDPSLACAFDGDPEALDAARRLARSQPGAMAIFMDGIHWLAPYGVDPAAPASLKDAAWSMRRDWQAGYDKVLAHLTRNLQPAGDC